MRQIINKLDETPSKITGHCLKLIILSINDKILPIFGLYPKKNHTIAIVLITVSIKAYKKIDQNWSRIISSPSPCIPLTQVWSLISIFNNYLYINTPLAKNTIDTIVTLFYRKTVRWRYYTNCCILW